MNLKKSHYKKINVDLSEYIENEKIELYKTNAGYIIIIAIILIIQLVFNLNLTSRIITDIFILTLIFAEMSSTVGLKKRMITNREERLQELFDDKLDLDSDIYYSNSIKYFDKNEIQEICVIDNKYYIKIDNTYIRIHAIRYEDDWIENLISANHLCRDHYSVLYSRELIDDIDPIDFKAFVNSNECKILAFYEHSKQSKDSVL